MEVAAVQAAKDKAVADSARIAAVMERDALKNELARTQLAMKATEDKVDALQRSTRETNDRMALMERMLAALTAGANQAHSGQGTEESLLHPPNIQRTEEDAHQLLQDEDPDNPMFTPGRSNVTRAEGHLARPHELSPSAEPPSKVGRAAERLTDGDSDMHGAAHAGPASSLQRNIHHKGGGHMPLEASKEQQGESRASGGEAKDQC